MQTDPRVIAFRYLMTLLQARISAVAAGDQESGALSLEWVAIAIVLVTAALALAMFLAGKLAALESLIPD
jgi:hypothetical protein